MEKDRTLPTSHIPLSHDSSSLTGIYFCSICQKPFTNATSRDRHFRYCRRHTRSRPRSCRACNAAKTKCSFEVPCLRCTKRGFECVYDDSVAGVRRTLPGSAAAAHEVGKEPYRPPNTSFASGNSHADDGFLSHEDFAFTDVLGGNDSQLQVVSGNKRQSIDLSTQRSPLREFLTFDELFAFENDTLDQHQFAAAVPGALSDVLDQKTASWCVWMRGNVSLASVTETPLVKSNWNDLAVPHLGRPHAQHNADLIIRSLRACPTMMLRRETFPWFIHPHSQLLSKSTGADLPKALSNCMSIAQMFASRTSETKYFLRQTIGAEYRRFTSEMYAMSIFELLAAMQACMIYLIMYIIDYSPEDEENARELLLALHELYVVFKKLGGGCSEQSEVLKTSTNWGDWIFAESQRRFANLWLLVGCVVCVKNGNVCDASQSYRILPLPCPKSLWEAPTQSAWESEYEACRIFHTTGLVSLGDLIDAQQSDCIPSNARKLDRWNAGVDNLGCLLNLVGTMI